MVSYNAATHQSRPIRVTEGQQNDEHAPRQPKNTDFRSGTTQRSATVSSARANFRYKHSAESFRAMGQASDC